MSNSNSDETSAQTNVPSSSSIPSKSHTEAPTAAAAQVNEEEEPLIDPSLLKNLTPFQRAEALAAAAAARRAEERAERRALERAIERKRREREEDRIRELEAAAERKKKRGLSEGGAVGDGGSTNGVGGINSGGGGGSGEGKIVFVSKKRRGEGKSGVGSSGSVGNEQANGGTGTKSNGDGGRSHHPKHTSTQPRQQSQQHQQHLTTKELNAIKKSYLGKSALLDEATVRKQEIERQKRERRARQMKKITFKFEWDASEDTTANDDEPPQMQLDNRKSKSSSFSRESNRSTYNNNHRSRNSNTQRSSSSNTDNNTDVNFKPLHKMTNRDWRIFRENHDITVRGGKAPPPLRSFRESNPTIHPTLIDAIENVLAYRKPSPIQRQAIPIGLQRRDLIGVAETGSGKTAAFGIPLCHCILSLPSSAFHAVADEGPLALVMAPTRELALQINAEFVRLVSRHGSIRMACVIGGQPIQKQAMELRNGVHIVVGTPGRINDCIEMAYLVLNQCTYIVLDEADRMIDLGFAPQIEQVMDAMGGLLKSEDERVAYQQEMEDLKSLQEKVPVHRLTAMFSATMPTEVQVMAKKYLRHPAVVSIGDQDSGKNQRITQKVLFLSSPKMKERALRDVLQNQTRTEDKVIVFVNERKHADFVGRIVERIPRRCVVLHGGKSQDLREEHLDAFRRGGLVLVATDVAGRGLDIKDVKHVINYDLPTRSIDNYCHRIGRTGRAGTEGVATSFITDEDEGIMSALKSYLESTGSPVPDRLAKHPAASVGNIAGLIH